MTQSVKNVGDKLANLFSRLVSLQAIKTLPVKFRHGLVFGSAFLYRLVLRRVVFIGVTGSTGKTTTKELIATVLSTRLQGHKNRGFRMNSATYRLGLPIPFFK